jgi:hypothetical protein
MALGVLHARAQRSPCKKQPSAQQYGALQPDTAACGPALPWHAAAAARLRRGRPWEMALVVYGFPTQVQALQFEWAWQHPDKSKAARPVAQGLKKHQKYGTAGKVGGGGGRRAGLGAHWAASL